MPKRKIHPGARVRRWLTAVVLSMGLAAGAPVVAHATDTVSGGGAVAGALRADLRQYLAARGTAEHISGVSLTVTYPGHRPEIDLAAGTTTYSGDTPLSPYDSWQIGSNTKAFTSVMILQLEAEGRLSIDDTLGKWLPQYPAWSAITIRRLLDMTSGIPEYTAQPAFVAAVEADPNTVFTAGRLVSYVYGLPLGGAVYAYSNTNYILAQMIIERASHDTYADQLTKRIIVPLRLSHTCYAPYTCPASTAARMPTGYFFMAAGSPVQGMPVPALNLTFAQGAGAIVASLPDMATWDRALYRGDLLPPRQQHELESLISITTSQPITSTTLTDPEGYGLGVAQVTTGLTGTAWFYEGQTYGFRALHLYLPRSRVLIAVATNSAVADDQLSALIFTVYQTLQANGALT